GRRPLIPSKISCGVRAGGTSAFSFSLVATARRTGLRGDRLLGLFLFAVRLRLILAFFAFRFLAILPPLFHFRQDREPESSGRRIVLLDPVTVLFHAARAAGMALIGLRACPRSSGLSSSALHNFHASSYVTFF